MKDKRKHERKEMDGLCVVQNRATGEVFGVLADLSVDGAMMLCEQPVQTGHVTECRVSLPQQILGSSEVSFDAECRWCTQDEAAGRYRVGFRLLNVPTQDRAAIQILSRHWTVWQFQEAGITLPSKAE